MENETNLTTAHAIPANNQFEELKQTNRYGAEYWTAREIMTLLGYKQWRRFEAAVKKAITSCEQSSNDSKYHFVSAGKPISGGKGAVQVVSDFHLSRFACYLIAQNGDSRKPEIANAQKYFAIQTRRQELSDQAQADADRLELRKRVSLRFRELSGAAQNAGVQSKMFGVFHDAGYKGLYGGLGSEQIKARKSIDPKENLMDRMGSTELAANQFRLTQARDRLATVHGQREAIATNERVGIEVRAAIKRIGGAMPEDLKPDEHIKKVRKRLAGKAPPAKIELDAPVASGLAGSSGQPVESLDDL